MVLCADCDQHAPLKSIASIQGPVKLRNSSQLNTTSATKRPSTQTLEFEPNITSLLFKKSPISGRLQVNSLLSYALVSEFQEQGISGGDKDKFRRTGGQSSVRCYWRV